MELCRGAVLMARRLLLFALVMVRALWEGSAQDEEDEVRPFLGMDAPPIGHAVPFAEVWAHSYCRALEVLVEVSREYPGVFPYIVRPACVPLFRCGGCCSHEGQRCAPTATYNASMQVLTIKPFHKPEMQEMSFLQHGACECRTRRNGQRRGRNRDQGKRRRKEGGRGCSSCSGSWCLPETGRQTCRRERPRR